MIGGRAGQPLAAVCKAIASSARRLRSPGFVPMLPGVLFRRAGFDVFVVAGRLESTLCRLKAFSWEMAAC
jgi:hypothetical protein